MHLPKDVVGGGDPLLAALGPQGDTLVTHPDGESRYRFDIHLQGEHETALLDFTNLDQTPSTTGSTT